APKLLAEVEAQHRSHLQTSRGQHKLNSLPESQRQCLERSRVQQNILAEHHRTALSRRWQYPGARRQRAFWLNFRGQFLFVWSDNFAPSRQLRDELSRHLRIRESVAKTRVRGIVHRPQRDLAVAF